MDDGKASPATASAEELFAEYLERVEQESAEAAEPWLAAACARCAGLTQLVDDYEKGALALGVGDSNRAGFPLSVVAGAEIGDFRLVRRLGSGFQGTVWEAQQLSLGRRVALKFVRPERVSDDTIAMLAREARAGGRLTHPGIVAVYGYGETDDLHWIAQELVPGERTLRDFIELARAEHEPPAGYYRRVAELVASIADGLQVAHDAGVIHRDIKPLNILLTRDGRPKITDFGLARVSEESASVSGEVLGTYMYMSPEQIQGHRGGLDERTDVFSLGVVLYELLALQRPFEGDTTVQVTYKILREDPPDLRKVRSRVPRELGLIAGKALEKEPHRRYPSMAEFAADLRRFLGHEPIHARPPGAWDRAQKWVRRHPAKAATSSVAALAFVVISALLIETLRAKRELGETIGELETANGQVARLSDAQNVEELRQQADSLWPQADALWPVDPRSIEASSLWIRAAQVLVDQLPDHRAQLSMLRRKARERTDSERRADRASHPNYGRYSKLSSELIFRREALHRRRDGGEVELPDVSGPEFPDDPEKLARLARPLVDPDREEFGREALGLALGLRALAGAAPDRARKLGEPVVWGYHALGMDEHARATAQDLIERATKSGRGSTAAKRLARNLEQAIVEETSDEALQAAELAVQQLEAECAKLEAALAERESWSFAEEDAYTRWWHDQLDELIQELESLADPETGLLSANGVSPEHGWSVPRRLASAIELRDRFAPGGECAAEWEGAREAIREHPGYDGLDLPVQTGLVPLGPDPDSGLWEFWLVVSGERPDRGSQGFLEMTEETGLVLVLLPGGQAWIGAEANSSTGHNREPNTDMDQAPVHRVVLSPFFLSKTEMSQAQWERLTGANPSFYPAGHPVPPIDATHPVEQISWHDCTKWLPRLGLTLPTEAQWEYAARAGTEQPWWTGKTIADLRAAEAANLADQSAIPFGFGWANTPEARQHDDGFAVHAPVDALAPNPFGLHHVHGNVMEWCLDGYDQAAYSAFPTPDPVAPYEQAEDRVVRGGSFVHGSGFARSAWRFNQPPTAINLFLGVRPARAIERP